MGLCATYPIQAIVGADHIHTCHAHKTHIFHSLNSRAWRYKVVRGCASRVNSSWKCSKQNCDGIPIGLPISIPYIFVALPCRSSDMHGPQMRCADAAHCNTSTHMLLHPSNAPHQQGTYTPSTYTKKNRKWARHHCAYRCRHWTSDASGAFLQRRIIGGPNKKKIFFSKKNAKRASRRTQHDGTYHSKKGKKHFSGWGDVKQKKKSCIEE